MTHSANFREFVFTGIYCSMLDIFAPFRIEADHKRKTRKILDTLFCTNYDRHDRDIIYIQLVIDPSVIC